MEEVRFSETFIPVYQTTMRYFEKYLLGAYVTFHLAVLLTAKNCLKAQ
jgi:hypothetical protein